MERRIEHLEERLKALQGALRLRGVWSAGAPGPLPAAGNHDARPVPRLRLGTRNGG